MDYILIFLACLLSTADYISAELNKTNDAQVKTNIEVTPKSVKLDVPPGVKRETLKYFSARDDKYSEFCPCYPRGKSPVLEQLGDNRNDLLRLVVYIYYSKGRNQFYLHIPNRRKQSLIPDIYDIDDTLNVVRDPYDVQMFKMYTDFMQESVIYPVIQTKIKKHEIPEEVNAEKDYDEPVSYPGIDDIPAVIINNKNEYWPESLIEKRPLDISYQDVKYPQNKAVKIRKMPALSTSNDYYSPHNVDHNDFTPKKIVDRPVTEQQRPTKIDYDIKSSVEKEDMPYITNNPVDFSESNPNIPNHHKGNKLRPDILSQDKLKPIDDMMYFNPEKPQELEDEVLKIRKQILNHPDNYYLYPNDGVPNNHKNLNWNPYSVQEDDYSLHPMNPSRYPWKHKQLSQYPQHLKKYPFLPWYYNTEEPKVIAPNYDPNSDKFIYGSQKLPLPPTVVPFDKWLQNQVNKINKPDKGSAFDIYIVRYLLEKILLDNGMRISPDGYIVDLEGRKINMDNLSLRPILIGGPLALKHVIENMDNKLKLPNSPYLKAVLVISRNPIKILGAVPLGSTYLPRGQLWYSGEVNGHEHNYNLSNVPLYNIKKKIRFQKGINDDEIEHYLSSHPNGNQKNRYLAVESSKNKLKINYPPHDSKFDNAEIGISSLEEILYSLRPKTELSNNLETEPSLNKHKLVGTQFDKVKFVKNPESILRQLFANDETSIKSKTKINGHSKDTTAMPLLLNSQITSMINSENLNGEKKLNTHGIQDEGKPNKYISNKKDLEINPKDKLQLHEYNENEVSRSHSTSTTNEDLSSSNILTQRSHTPGVSSPIHKYRFAPEGYLSRMRTTGESIIQQPFINNGRLIIQDAHSLNPRSQIPIHDKDDEILHGLNQDHIITGHKRYNFEPDHRKILIAPHSTEVISNADLNNSMDLYPGFRIIGGHAATSSGAPLSNKGRSGQPKKISQDHSQS